MAGGEKGAKIIASSRLPPALICGKDTETDERTATSMDQPISPSPTILYREWQAEYLAALLEFDPKLLRERLQAAEGAIFKRLQAMSQSTENRTERQAIEDAQAALRVLKRDRLNFPDWEKK
jgi:hypothetical protein